MKKEEIYNNFAIKYKEKHKDFTGFTRIQYNFIMWLLEEENQKQGLHQALKLIKK